MPTVSLDTGVDLYYRDVGDGPPLVCVHGGFMSHHVWDPLFTTLPEHHRVVAVDLRGHGRSEAPYGTCTDDALAADIDAFLDSLNLSRVTYLGWSLGATTGVTYLGQFEDDRIDRMILSSTGIFEGLARESRRRTSDTPGTDDNFLDFAALRQAHRQDNPEAMWQFVDGLFTENTSKYTREWLYRIALQTPLDVVLDVLELYETMDYERLYEYATTIDRPVLAIQGVHDSTASVADTAHTAGEVFPAGKFVAFDESAHVPFVEQPDRFADTVRTFATGRRE
jgi:pimeloyl-ACP methyl ester carboxylesterase